MSEGSWSNSINHSWYGKPPSGGLTWGATENSDTLQSKLAEVVSKASSTSLAMTCSPKAEI